MEITFSTRLRVIDDSNGVLGDFKVGVPIEGPFVSMGNLLREASRIVEAWSELWISYYGETTPAGAGAKKWCLEVDAQTEGKELFQQAFTETLPLDLVGRATVTARLHAMLEHGALKLQ